jgi:hypothetical protein
VYFFTPTKIRKMKNIFTLCFLACSVFSYGQYIYSTSTTPGNPGGVMTTDEFPNPGGTGGWGVVLSGGNSWSSPQTIPFAFDFNGNTVSQYIISPNGVVSFTTSATAAPGATASALPSASIPDNSICVWGFNLSGSNDEVVTNTLGTAGSQQHWIWFTSMSVPSDPNCWHYWAIVLEEGSNNIYMVDMRNSCTTALTVGIQIDGTTAYQVCGSPNLDHLSDADATSADNYYYEFAPGTPSAHDMAGTAFTMNPFELLSNAPFTVTADVENKGSATITSMDVNYRIDNGATVTAPLTGLNIAPCASYSISHPTPWTPAGSGGYTVEVWASNLNGNPDGNPSDDMVSGSVTVAAAFTQRVPLYETFTSSTCGPCTPANALLEGLFNDPMNDGKFTSIKYQMSWPGTGDPYFTDEGNVLRNQYAINSIPRLEVDGGWDQNANNVTQALMDQWATVVSFVDIDVTYSQWGQTFQANVTIDPVESINNNNLILRVAVFEYTTFNNLKSNGETEFFHVMKKMLPDEDGTVLPPLVGGQQQTFTLSHDFQGSYVLPPNANSPVNHAVAHTVEEFSDLGVVAWIQDTQTLEVLQSTTGTVAVGIEEEGKLFAQGKVYPNPVIETATLAFNLTESVSDLVVRVFDTTGKLVSAANKGGFVAGRNQVQVDTDNLDSGLYIIHLIAGGETMTLNMSVTK